MSEPIPPLPPGFTLLEEPEQQAPPLPPGFTLLPSVEDPIAARISEARARGYLTPQPGEMWGTAGARYRQTPEGLQKLNVGQKSVSYDGSVRPWERISGDGSWAPVTDPEEVSRAYQSAHLSLPGMAYTGPEGAGLGERIKAAGKQVLLDLATDDQKTHADFLVNHFTPERGYMFVPMDDGRVMLVHEDPDTKKITRRLVNAAGLSVGDIVHASPSIGAAMATGGLTAGLTLPIRMGAQALTAGAVRAGAEGALQAAGSERPFDTAKVVTESIAGGVGEGLGGLVNKVTGKNTAIRNAIEDRLSGQTMARNADIDQVLERAGIAPDVFDKVDEPLRRQVVRTLSAAEERAASGASSLTREQLQAARETARNAVEARSAGVRLNAFEATPDPHGKAYFGSLLRGERGEPERAVAQEIRRRSIDDMAASNAATQADIAAVNNALPVTTPEAGIEQTALALHRARNTSKEVAKGIEQKAWARPVFAKNLTSSALRDLVSDVKSQISVNRIIPEQSPQTRRALTEIIKWADDAPRPTIGGVQSARLSTEDLRRLLRDRWTEATGHDKNQVQNLIDLFDRWIERRAVEGARHPSVARDLYKQIEARKIYSRHVATYEDARPSLSGMTAGDDIRALAESFGSKSQDAIASLIGSGGRVSKTTMDTLDRVTHHIERHIAHPKTSTKASSSMWDSRNAAQRSPSDAALAWDGLRQAVWLKNLTTPDAFGSGPVAERIMKRLFTPQEMEIMRRQQRIAEIVEGASEKSRGRLADEGVGRMMREGIKYMVKYRAVRDLHRHGAIVAIAQTLLSGAGYFGFEGLRRSLMRMAIGEAARNPMYAFKGVTGPMTQANRLTSKAIYEIISEELLNHDDPRAQELKDRLRVHLGVAE